MKISIGRKALDDFREQLRDEPSAEGVTFVFTSKRHKHKSPAPLSMLAAEITQGLDYKSVIDPVCGIGGLLSAVTENAGARDIHGIEIERSAYEEAVTLFAGQAVLVHGDMFEDYDTLLQSYDLIVADPPLYGPAGDRAVEVFNLRPRCRFWEGVLAWVAEKLSPRGRALVVVPENFFGTSVDQRARKSLGDRGLSIDAAFRLPEGSRGNTSMASYLLALSWGDQKEMFVGELSDDTHDRKQLVSNYKKRKFTENAKHGRLVSPDEFRSLEVFVARESLSRATRALEDWNPYVWSDLFSETKRIDSKQPLSEDLDTSDRLYLKLNGKIRASLYPNELRTGKDSLLREVVALKVNSDLATPTYLVNWFNDSKIGRLTIDAHTRNGKIPRLDLKGISGARLYLPSLQEQATVLSVLAKLRGLQSELQEINEDLARGGHAAADLLERATEVNHEDHYLDWVDTLPFPLASILYRHHAMGNDSEKLKYPVLLNFFEALAAFLATIHLSALATKPLVWEPQYRRLLEKLRQQDLRIERPSFGAWKLVCEFSAGIMTSIRQGNTDLEDGGEKLVQQMYSTTGPKIIDMLLDPRLTTILQAANKIRNDDFGHTGAVGEEQAKAVHTQLLDLLDQTREVFGRRWKRYQLIQPSVSSFKNGIYYTNVNLIVGTRSPFVEEQHRVLHPMEDGQLYLLDIDDGTGLLLKPFIKVMPSPKVQAMACFIFNRLEGDNGRLVSYHFEEESEITIPAADIKAFLSSANAL